MNRFQEAPRERRSDRERSFLGLFFPGPGLPPEILGQQLRIIQGNLPLGLLVNALLAVILGWSLLGSGMKAPILLWMLGSILLGAVRYADCRFHRKELLEPAQMYRARRHLQVGGALQGILWGVAGTFLFPAPPMQQIVVVSAITTITAGAIIVIAPIWSVYALFALPAIIPASLRFLAAGQPAQTLLGCLGLGYGCILLFLAARASRWLEHSLAATQAQDSQALHYQNASAQDRRKVEEHEESLRRSQKLESLGVLAGGIAHDFNNLLAVLLGNLEMLQLTIPDDSRAQVFLGNMGKTVDRAKNLTKQMLAYSGKGHFAVQNLDLNHVVRDLTSLLTVCISKRTVLHLDLSAETCSILADQAQLQQVVMNLVTNASEALDGKDGEIYISTRIQDLDATAAARASRVVPTRPGSHVLLEVRDTGRGMGPEVLARIFDPFYTTKENGRGLGLATMMGILKGHGAGIEIHTRPGQGSTFRLFFPASQGVPENIEPAAPEPKGPFSGQVLLVDDEPGILETSSAMLERLGFQVATARNGLEALEFMEIHGSEVDLVLLDLTMPQLDGRQTLRVLHRLHPRLPVILSSGFDPRQTRTGLRELDAQAFLQKPYTLSELQRVLARVMGASLGNAGTSTMGSGVSLTDPLTGLRNRRFLAGHMPVDIAQVERSHRNRDAGALDRLTQNVDLLFLMVDLDHFKVLKERYGPIAGDRLLQQVGEILGRTARTTDTVARFDGDKFLVVARQAARADSHVVAERIRALVNDNTFQIGDQVKVRCTCSVGFSTYPLLQGEISYFRWEQVVAIADHCLRAAKCSGRNAWVGIVPDRDSVKVKGEELPEDLTRLVQAGVLPTISSLDTPVVWGDMAKAARTNGARAAAPAG